MAEARITHRLRGAEPPGLAEARTWVGERVTDALGIGVGKLEDIWVEAETGEPAWLLIREGRFGGSKHRLVPFAGATEGAGRIWLPYERSVIRSSPLIGSEDVLTAELGEQLRSHYGVVAKRHAPQPRTRPRYTNS